MFRFSILEQAEKYLMEQNIAAYLNKDNDNPDLSSLIIDLGSGAVSGFDRTFLLNLIFRHGGDSWEEIAADVLQIRSVMMSSLSDEAMSALDGILSFLLPELDAGCIYIDRERRMLIFSHDIIVNRSSTVDSIVSQLDGFLFFIVISLVVFFDPLFEAVYRNLTGEQGIGLIRERAAKAEEAVRRRKAAGTAEV